ncbi:MAG: hypothetical protein WC917_00110 [Bacilli bacterium]|jgi:hypothetical protein
MIQKKLKIDLSPLWNQPSQKFTVRFLDVNEKEKRILAQRIKDVAKQARIKNLNGPNVQTIYETLSEINPIIFGEYHQRNTYRQVQGYRVFNINTSRSLSGFWFHQLCQAIYMIDCLKRDVTKNEMYDIAYLTIQDWDIAQNHVNQNYTIQDPEERERRVLLNDIGMDDIANARHIAEDNGANRIPDGVFEEEHEEIEETLHDVANNILNNLIDNEGNVEFRSVTEEVFRNRPEQRIEQSPEEREIRRIEREINDLQRMENNHEIGSFNWAQQDTEVRNRIDQLRRDIDHLRTEIEVRRQRETRPERPALQDYYHTELREGQAPERHTFAVDMGSLEREQIDIRVPTGYNPGYGTRRINGIRPTRIAFDEVEESEENQL